MGSSQVGHGNPRRKSRGEIRSQGIAREVFDATRSAAHHDVSAVDEAKPALGCSVAVFVLLV